MLPLSLPTDANVSLRMDIDFFFYLGSSPLPVFTALHGMQTRSSDENYICPSVCLSNRCIVTEWKKDLSRFLYHTRHLA